jgi:hypothetical protein
LITPQIEIPEGSRALNLSYFKRGNDTGDGQFLGNLEILVSTTGIDTGIPKGTLAPIGVAGNKIGDWTVISRRQSSGIWQEYEVDLSAFVNEESIRIAFRHKDNNRDYIALDEVKLVKGTSHTFGIISGVVTNKSDGLPISGAVIAVVDTNISATTNANGVFFLQVPAGTVRITVTKEGFTTFRSETFSVVAGRQVVRNINMETPGSITGVVRNRNTNAVMGGVLVRVAEGLQATTNMSGVYTITNIPAGVVKITGTREGFEPYESGFLTVTSGQQLTHDFEMGSVNEADTIEMPLITELNSNFPNPFNPSTTIRFSIGQTETGGELVNIRIYNIRGQVVKTLVNDYFVSGWHNVVWNGTDDRDRVVGSGIYFYKMTAGEYSKMRRMILMK